MTELEFVNDPNVNETTRTVRLLCMNDGHLPHTSTFQGGSGLIYGCWCGWVKLKNPVSHHVEDWKDVPHAVFKRGID